MGRSVHPGAKPCQGSRRPRAADCRPIVPFAERRGLTRARRMGRVRGHYSPQEGAPMKRTPFLLALTLIAVACASMPSSEQGLVSRALQAQGGADALGAVKTLTVKGTLRQWEPEQSAKAGGEMRLANDSTFEM